MRGRFSRRDITVSREEVYRGYSYASTKVSTEVAYRAHAYGSLQDASGRDLEDIDISFQRPTYDEALNALLKEFEELDIEVVL